MRRVEQLRVEIIAALPGRRAVREDAVTALAESLASMGLQTPITVRIVDDFIDEDGAVVGGQPVLVTGAHRLEAARSLGWEKIECFVMDDGDEIDAQLWEISENLHRSELTALERAEQIARWVQLTDEKRKVAQVAPPGGRQPKDEGIRAAARELGIDRDAARRAVKIAALPDEAKEAARAAGLDDNQAALLAAAKSDKPADTLAQIAGKNLIVTKYTGDQEWYTPGEYVDRARCVMGSIDCDPASNPHAQQTVQAGVWHSKEDDGLAQEWRGNVWLNPPYSYPEIAQFIGKLIEEFRIGNVKQAVLLTNNSADTAWFHDAACAASAICFTRGRIAFYKADDRLSSPTNGQAFFYFGPDKVRFAEIFASVGSILECVLPVARRCA